MTYWGFKEYAKQYGIQDYNAGYESDIPQKANKNSNTIDDRRKIAQDLERATQNKNKQQENPATTNAGFRQLEAKQTADIAQKAKQYSNAHPTYLNPYIPKEAAQLRLETPSDTAKRISGVAATGGTVGTLETIAKDASMFIPALPVAEKLLPKAAELIKTGNRENMAAIERKGKSMAGAKGTLGEDIAYGIGKETPAIVASYGGVGAVSKIPAVGKFLTGSGKVLETGRRGVAAGAIYTPLAEEDPTAKDYVENMAMFGVGDMGFTAAGKALKPLAGDVVRYAKQAVNESKPGELLNWRNVKGMEADSAKLRAQDMASVLMDELNKLPPNKNFNPEGIQGVISRSGDDLDAGKVKPEFLNDLNREINSERVKEFYVNGQQENLKPKEQSIAEESSIDYLTDEAPAKPEYADWFNQEAFNKKREQQANAVQDFYAEGKQGSPFKQVDTSGQLYAPEISRKSGQAALPSGKTLQALPEGRTRFEATPDGKIIDVQEGTFPLAKVEGVDYAADTSIGNRQRIAQDIDQPIPRSDVGDPAYLKGLEGKYNELVNAEVNRLKGQVQGVVKYMPGEDAPLLRSSMNAKWYRDFYAKNGRQPHEGEYRDMAINNLTRGVEDDFEGAIAPNQEFLSTLSELSRGQKLPEEWHGLQQSVRELEGAKADQDIPVTADSVKVGDTVYNQSGEPLKVLSIVNKNTMRVMDSKGTRAPIKFSEVRAENKEIDPLVNEMKAEQTKVEPFGLNRDTGRLSEIENAFRNKTGMKDQADFRDYEAVNFKADANSDQDLKILRAAFEKRSFGLFKTQAKVDLAPEALERPEYQAAGVIADKLGLRLVPFKGNGARGAQKGRTIYVNEKLDDPLDYIFWHEVGHSMKNTHFDHYLNLLEISLDHVENGKAIRKHYTSQDYKEIEVPDEFAADIFAESLSTPGFFAKVADKAPELLKPLLEAIGRMVDNIKGIISKDDSLTPYLKDVEGLRERIKQEVAMPYFKDAMGEKEFAKTFGDSWTESAAKVKSEVNFKLSPQNPLDDFKAMVEHGSSIIGKASFGDFVKSIEAKFPDQLAGYSLEIKDRLVKDIWQKSQKLNENGSVEIKMGQNSMTVKKPAPKTIEKTQSDYTMGESKPANAETINPNSIELGDYKDISGRNIYNQDIYRNYDQFFGKTMGESEQESGNILREFNQQKNSHIDYQNKWLEKLKEVTDGMGIAKNSKASALVQRYGEGGTKFYELAPFMASRNKAAASGYVNRLKKQYGSQNITPEYDDAGKLIGVMVHKPYTYDDLVKEVGEKEAGRVVKAVDWFRTSYKELIEDINKVRAQIYPNAEKRMNEIKTEIESLKDEKSIIAVINNKLNTYYDLIDDINNSPNRSPERKRELISEVEAKIEKLRISPLYTKEGRLQRIEELNNEYEKAMRGKYVPEREDYFHHFKESSGLKGIYNAMGTPAEISPELAGKSDFTLPKSKFHGFMQERGVGKYKEDAVEGFLKYLPEASYSINIDPMISKFEGLADEIAAETRQTKDANNFINYLRKFSQDLSGKTNPEDRVQQEKMSRKVLDTLVLANSRAKSNAIRYNLGTPVIQPMNIWQGIAFAKQHSFKGFGNAFKDIFADNSMTSQSTFLKERFNAQAYRQFDTRLIDKPGKFADWLLEFSDRLGAEFVWHACYQKGLHMKNVSDPIKFADANTRRLIAGRGIGEMPLEQKSKLRQMVMPFTYEVSNMWKIQKDFVSEKDFSGLVLLYAGLWVGNNIIESIRGEGNRPLFDPVDAVADAIGIMIKDDGKSAGEKSILAGGRLAGEVLSNAPAGQYLAQIYPQYGFEVFGKQMPTRRELLGDSDPTRYGTGILPVKAIQQPFKYLLFPSGGAQINKTLGGLASVGQEGVYNKNGELMYPVEPNGTNLLKGVLFGKSGLEESGDYYKNNRRPLSETQTAIVDRSNNREAAYRRIIRQREIDRIENEIKDVRNDNNLDRADKNNKISALRRELGKVRRGEF